MATTTPSSTSASISIPVVDDITDTVMTYHKVWPSSGDAVFLWILSNMGEGKTSSLRALSKMIPMFFIDARVFSKNYGSAIPVLKDDEIQLMAPINRDLLDWSKKVAKQDIRPIIVVDEAGMIPEDDRKTLVTELVDGVFFIRNGLKVRPMVIMLSNGKTFARSSNEPLAEREDSRAVQVIAVTDGRPVNYPGFDPNLNSPVAIALRKEYREWVLENFASGKNRIPDSELPNNHPGNPRAQSILLQFIENIKSTKAATPKALAIQIARGYIRNDCFEGAMRLIMDSFSILPRTVADINQALATQGYKFPQADDADWISWAKNFLHDSSDFAVAKKFAKLAGCPAEAYNAIVSMELK